MNFDRKLEFQFGLFLATSETTVDRNTVFGLTRFFEPKTRFPEPRLEEQIMQIGTQALQVPTVSWGTGGVWRMVWTPLRLDIYADAAQYLSVADKQMSLSMARERLASGLARAAGHLTNQAGLTVHRLVVVVTGEASEDPSSTGPQQRVADRYFRDSIRNAVKDKKIIDLGVRIDHGGAFEHAGSSFPLHRIETIGTTLAFTAMKPELTTRVTLDVNTSPSRGIAPIPPEAIEPFYAGACDWISERLSEGSS